MNQPPLTSPINSHEWQIWFDQLSMLVNAMQMSGTTADRPTKGLYIGRVYFDTTLGKPIWLQSYAAGVAVWCLATGAAA